MASHDEGIDHICHSSHQLVLILSCALLGANRMPRAKKTATAGASSPGKSDAVAAMSLDMMMPSQQDADTVPEGFQPVERKLRRLSNHQYRHFISNSTKHSMPIADSLPAENQLHGFRSIAAAIFSLSLTDVEKHSRATLTWVSKAFFSSAELRNEFIDCDLDEASCIRSFVERIGNLLLASLTE